MQSLSGSVVLIRYRDHSGFAIVNFKQYRQPVLTPTPELPGQTAIQFVGQDTLLLTSSNDFHVFDQDKQYVVIDISDPLKPTSVVMVRGVKQQLDRRETGTTFLLSQDGLTVIRRPSVEEDYQSESNPAN